MSWYRDTAKGGTDPNDFSIPEGTLLRVATIRDGANTLRNSKYIMGFRSRQ